MNVKRKTRILITIIILAVAGILVSQIKWLNVRYKLSRERQQHRINLALQKTANQLISYQNIKIRDKASTKQEKNILKKT